MAEKLVKSYMDFRGGWNADSAPDNLADNELELADNIVLDQRGSFSKRKGTAPFNATSYAAEVEWLREWAQNDGSVMLLAVIGNDLCKVAEDGTKTVLLTLDVPSIGWFTFQNKFWFTAKVAATDVYKTYDGTTVADVTPNAAADNDLTPIKRCRMFLWHPRSMRFFAAGDPNDKAALYFSEPNDPTYFKNTSKLYPATGDGPVVGLALFGEAVLAFYKQGTVWAYQGSNPATDATWKKLAIVTGPINGRTVALTPNSLSYLGLGGIYSISPGLLDYNVVLLSGEELVKNRAESKVASVLASIAKPDLACVVYDPQRKWYLLAYCDDAALTRNNKVLVLDWNLGAFYCWTGLQVNDFCLRTNGDLLLASKNYILKYGSGYSDWNVDTGATKAIEVDVKTKQWNLDMPFHQKRLSRVFFAAKQYDVEVSSVSLTIASGYNAKVFNDVGISLDESFTWGEVWGSSWGWTDYVGKELLCRLKGSRFQIEAVNKKLDEALTIYGFGLEFKPLSPRGVRVNG